MYEFTFYSFSNREYFDTPAAYAISNRYSEMLQSLLPESYTVSRSDVWLQANPRDRVLKPQGFKIHLSSRLSDASRMLEQFVPVCVNAGVAFKIVADPALHQFLNAKRYSRGGAGKFATIYPPDDQCFVQLLEALHHATRSFEGPYILSDKRYKNSKVVFYRYGGFKRITELNVDGTRRMMIWKPDGTLMHDARMPYYQCPEWVSDPVDGNAISTTDEEESTLLNGRYEVVEALNFTNTGGIYRALDQVTGQTVVIKEARPNTDLWAGGRRVMDATIALRHEEMALQFLRDLPFIPRLIESFVEWEHVFLVTSFAEGTPIDRLRAQDSVMLMTKIGDPAQTEKFCRIFQTITLKLLEALDVIHQRGVVLGDISPGNVFFNTETEDITFIDLESAQLPATSPSATLFATEWCNPGFRREERRVAEYLTPFDDSYACGMLLYNLLCPVQTLFDLDKNHPIFRILDYFVEAGLPAEVKSIINAFLEGNTQEVRQIAQSWDLSKLAAGKWEHAVA